MDHLLRSGDAIQLSMAFELQKIMRAVGEEVILISNDNEMCEAAKKEGMVVLSATDNSVEELRILLSGKE